MSAAAARPNLKRARRHRGETDTIQPCSSGSSSACHSTSLRPSSYQPTRHELSEMPSAVCKCSSHSLELRGPAVRNVRRTRVTVDRAVIPHTMRPFDSSSRARREHRLLRVRAQFHFADERSWIPPSGTGASNHMPGTICSRTNLLQRCYERPPFEASLPKPHHRLSQPHRKRRLAAREDTESGSVIEIRAHSEKTSRYDRSD